jgi:hypothetical protein
MWHTPDGDRVLTAGEWSLVRAGLGRAWDAVEAARDTTVSAGATSVRVFDALHYGQQVPCSPPVTDTNGVTAPRLGRARRVPVKTLASTARSSGLTANCSLCPGRRSQID